MLRFAKEGHVKQFNVDITEHAVKSKVTIEFPSIESSSNNVLLDTSMDESPQPET